jgi:hypothetical protein
MCVYICSKRTHSVHQQLFDVCIYIDRMCSLTIEYVLLLVHQQLFDVCICIDRMRSPTIECVLLLVHQHLLDVCVYTYSKRTHSIAREHIL